MAGFPDCFDDVDLENGIHRGDYFNQKTINLPDIDNIVRKATIEVRKADKVGEEENPRVFVVVVKPGAWLFKEDLPPPPPCT